MNMIIAPSSALNYNRSNTKLVMYLFNVDAETHIHSSFLEEALEADRRDIYLGVKEDGKRLYSYPNSRYKYIRAPIRD